LVIDVPNRYIDSKTNYKQTPILMKNLIYLLAISLSLVIVSCGSGKKDDEKAKTDSAANSVVEVESWEAFQLASNDLKAFKEKFEGKTVRIKNIPVVYMGGDAKLINGLAYSPTENKVSSTSWEADKAAKKTGLFHAIGDKKCVINPDMKYTFVFDMKFAEPFDKTKIKERENKDEENGDMVLVFHSLVTVESNAVTSEGSGIKMDNCVLKNVETK
jgi:hypothetical protein